VITSSSGKELGESGNSLGAGRKEYDKHVLDGRSKSVVSAR
jgi:hypothetical protein